MDLLNEMTLRFPVTKATDLILFEEQDRAERHYRSLYPALKDAMTAVSDVILGPEDVASEYVAGAEATGRGIMIDLAAEVRQQNNRSLAGKDRTADRLLGLTMLDEVREKGERILAVHTNIALTGRAAADFALVAAWHTRLAIPGAGVDRFAAMMTAYHDYYRERRSAWLGRLAELLNLSAGFDLEDLSVSWVAHSWASSEWCVEGIPSGWDVGASAGDPL